jgi:hypothetical protein
LSPDSPGFIEEKQIVCGPWGIFVLLTTVCNNTHYSSDGIQMNLPVRNSNIYNMSCVDKPKLIKSPLLWHTLEPHPIPSFQKGSNGATHPIHVEEEIFTWCEPPSLAERE